MVDIRYEAPESVAQAVELLLFLQHPKLKALGQGIAGEQQPAPDRSLLRTPVDVRSLVQSAALEHLLQQVCPLVLSELKQLRIRMQQQLLRISKGWMAGAQQRRPQTGPDALLCRLNRISR